MRRAVVGVCVGLALGGLTGCNNWYDRHGTPPVIQQASVTASVENSSAMLMQFAHATQLPTTPPLGSPEWYFVMEAGFNYVDEVCNRYIHELFFLNRDRDRIRNGLVLLDKTTSAILEATNTSRQAMQIVSQAFGLAQGSADILVNSYLYRIEPANIQKLVDEMRKAYRIEARARQERVNGQAMQYISPTSAYYGIQGYLSLCLPATIESKVNGIIGRTTIIADSSTRDSPVINVIAESLPPPSRDEVARGQGLALGSQIAVRNPNAPMQSPRQTSLEVPYRDIQVALCVGADGLPGKNTFEAVSQYLSGYNNQGASRFNVTSIDRRTLNLLLPALDRNIACDTARGEFRSAYEVGAFAVPDRNEMSPQNRIKSLQRKLISVLPSGGYPVNGGTTKVEESGQLTATTRGAIEYLRKTQFGETENAARPIDHDTLGKIQKLPSATLP